MYKITAKHIEALKIIAGVTVGKVHLNMRHALKTNGLVVSVPTGEVSPQGFAYHRDQLTEMGREALENASRVTDGPVKPV